MDERRTRREEDASNGGRTVPCAICGSRDVRRLYRLRTGYLDRSEEYDIHRCRACGHGFARGRVDDAYLGRIYSSGFHATSQQSVASEESPVMINARERTHWLSRGIGLRGRLLDIGAGTGAFVDAAGSAFQATGIELSGEAVAAARDRGIDLLQGDILTADLEPGSFDVITLWDVIASITDPVALIEKCAELSAPGGALVFTVPRIDSLARRMLGRFWPLWIPPVNLHWFSGDSIERLLADHGYRLERCDDRGKSVSLRFLVQKALRSVGMYGVERRLAGLVPGVRIYLNTHDISTVVARRDDREPAS